MVSLEDGMREMQVKIIERNWDNVTSHDRMRNKKPREESDHLGIARKYR
jgi:hypothetical protein